MMILCLYVTKITVNDCNCIGLYIPKLGSIIESVGFTVVVVVGWKAVAASPGVIIDMF